MDHFHPNLQSHMAKLSAWEGCICIYKPLGGLCELMYGRGLNTSWHRVKVQLMLLLLLLAVVVSLLLTKLATQIS